MLLTQSNHVRQDINSVLQMGTLEVGVAWSEYFAQGHTAPK